MADSRNFATLWNAQAISEITYMGDAPSTAACYCSGVG
jgi:hypothetical protein